MKKILIVEDCPSVNFFYRKLFKDSDEWQVTTCLNFDDALNILDSKKFDYIISDGHVKDSQITGLDFLKLAQIKVPNTIRLYVSGTIMPNPEDYSCFNAFINKKDLLGEELLQLLNCINDENCDEVPDSFFTKVFLS